MTQTWPENEEIIQRLREWLMQTGEDVAALQSRQTETLTGNDEFVDQQHWLDDGGRDQNEAHDRAMFGDVENAQDSLGENAHKNLQENSPAPPLPTVGLLELIAAFTALRHETKLQTKSSRGLDESVASAVEGLTRAIHKFETVQAREKDAAMAAAEPFASAIAGLDESLTRGAEAIAASRLHLTKTIPEQLRNSFEERFRQLGWWWRLLMKRRHQDMQTEYQEQLVTTLDSAFHRMTEGYALIQNRLKQLMEEKGIARIECVGRPVDPARMTVVELVDDPRAKPETVVEEVRPGYTYQDRVIRFAEVRAVRGSGGSPPLDGERENIGVANRLR